jgi:hypothetical protein
VGKIGVLQRHGGQSCGLPVEAGGVKRRQFAHQDAHRPAIGDDVVHGEQDDLFIGLPLEQAEAEEGAGG